MHKNTTNFLKVFKFSVSFGKSNNRLDACNLFYLVTHQSELTFFGNKKDPRKRKMISKSSLFKKNTWLLDHVIKSGFDLISDIFMLTRIRM